MFVAALSCFNEMLTEPYWNLMQSNRYFAPKHAFILGYLRDASHNGLQVTKNIQLKTELSLVVFRCQLGDFLDGGIFWRKDRARGSANIRLFGDLDFDMQKRRHASLHFRSSLKMWKRNKTSSFVNKKKITKKKKTSARQKLVTKAIRCAPEWRERSKEEQIKVMEKVKQKLAANKAEKQKTAFKIFMKNAIILDSFIQFLGVCSTTEELDDLMELPNALEALHARVRYRKFCRGENIQVTGSLRTLYARLSQHLV
ncbi:hypothetical protein PoB_001748100 [Plakobranchus ocellatus]|uniref:Uncharacterized protein n=1 Tax=Plakobranchus ocellatus TaxID=259542 RepID=A0AAV3Z533_9GAST|nr:hypothetical protein PoB_001748100 [Plakobranchus ocellatus]